MAEPTKRRNNSKQGMIRMHDKVSHPNLAFCENCHEPKEAHKVCYKCGKYGKEQIIEAK